MSFSQEVKNEIAKSKILKNIQNMFYELLGIYISINYSKSKTKYFTSENVYILERYKYILNYYCRTIDLIFNQEIIKQKNIYMLNCSVLDEIENINNINIKDLTDSFRISLLIGVFLGCGYINDPKENYHLEFVLNNQIYANQLNDLLNSIGVSSNITLRKEQYIIYVKDGDSISYLLGILGANCSLLKFEEFRIEKEMNNNLNRVINCETANLNKAIKASNKHIENIEYLKQCGEYEKLNDNLKEVCIVRKQNPELSLNELAIIIGISKSGLNNRLKKIDNIVKELKNEE